MPVISWIAWGMNRSGLISIERSSMIAPSCTSTVATSVILSRSGESPVVSISVTTKMASEREVMGQ